MWLNAFNYINLHDFAFIYFTYLNIYNIIRQGILSMAEVYKTPT